jgi:negative regulator of flagellin synthesis FlgM
VKIDGPIKKTPGSSVGPTQTRPGQGTEKADSVAQAPSDSVHLSKQAQALAGQTAGSGVFDAGKVDEIKAAIAEGTFKVDPEKVANGLLDTVTDLLHSRKG